MEGEENNSEDHSMEDLMKRSLLAKNKLAIIIKGPDGVQFCCVQCPIRCGDKEQLEKHLFVHNNVYRHLCGICGTGLKRKEHLDRHLLEHQQVRPHVCDICSKAFKRKEHLNIHKSIHSGDKSEVCMLCQKSFYRKDHLQKHLQTHTKMFLEHKIALSDQVIGVKAEVMEVDVSERFDDSSQDQDVGIEDIQITPDQHHITTDLARIHNEERPYACHLCEKTYKRKDHLKLHAQTHLKKDKICSECGRGFATDEKLLQHMNLHLHAYSIMNSDEDRTHLETLLAEHNIDISFLQPDGDSLLVPRHSVPALDKPPADRPERRHECDICHRKFKRRQHLVVHRNVHLKNQANIWCANCTQVRGGGGGRGRRRAGRIPGHQDRARAPRAPRGAPARRRQEGERVAEPRAHHTAGKPRRLNAVPDPGREFDPVAGAGVCVQILPEAVQAQGPLQDTHAYTHGDQVVLLHGLRERILPQRPPAETLPSAHKGQNETKESVTGTLPNQRAAKEKRRRFYEERSQARDHDTCTIKYKIASAASDKGALPDGDVDGQRRTAGGHHRPASALGQRLIGDFTHEVQKNNQILIDSDFK